MQHCGASEELSFVMIALFGVDVFLRVVETE